MESSRSSHGKAQVARLRPPNGCVGGVDIGESHKNIRISYAGGKGQSKGDPEIMFCGILMFMWPWGPYEHWKVTYSRNESQVRIQSLIRLCGSPVSIPPAPAKRPEQCLKKVSHAPKEPRPRELSFPIGVCWGSIYCPGPKGPSTQL